MFQFRFVNGYLVQMRICEIYFHRALYPGFSVRIYFSELDRSEFNCKMSGQMRPPSVIQLRSRRRLADGETSSCFSLLLWENHTTIPLIAKLRWVCLTFLLLLRLTESSSVCDHCSSSKLKFLVLFHRRPAAATDKRNLRNYRGATTSRRHQRSMEPTNSMEQSIC